MYSSITCAIQSFCCLYRYFLVSSIKEKYHEHNDDDGGELWLRDCGGDHSIGDCDQDTINAVTVVYDDYNVTSIKGK